MVALAGVHPSLVLAVLTEVAPVPAADADIVDGTIMTRLDVWLENTATVAQVNLAVASLPSLSHWTMKTTSSMLSTP